MKWEVLVHDCARSELQYYKSCYPAAYRAITIAFNEMKEMDDPRQHQYIKALRVPVKGWYRLAIYEYNLRIVFRLLWRKDDRVLEIWANEEIQDEGEHGIQITRVDRRGNVYNEALTSRRNRIK